MENVKKVQNEKNNYLRIWIFSIYNLWSSVFQQFQHFKIKIRFCSNLRRGKYQNVLIQKLMFLAKIMGKTNKNFFEISYKPNIFPVTFIRISTNLAVNIFNKKITYNNVFSFFSCEQNRLNHKNHKEIREWNIL